jgi:hypothetical protein
MIDAAIVAAAAAAAAATAGAEMEDPAESTGVCVYPGYTVTTALALR